MPRYFYFKHAITTTITRRSKCMMLNVKKASKKPISNTTLKSKVYFMHRLFADLVIDIFSFSSQFSLIHTHKAFSSHLPPLQSSNPTRTINIFHRIHWVTHLVYKQLWDVRPNKPPVSSSTVTAFKLNRRLRLWKYSVQLLNVLT